MVHGSTLEAETLLVKRKKESFSGHYFSMKETFTYQY